MKEQEQYKKGKNRWLRMILILFFGICLPKLDLNAMDRLAPEIQLTYSTDDRANYWQWGYLFSKQPVKIKVTAKDQMSGVKEIRILIEDESGEKIQRSKKFQPSAEESYELELPLDGKDFCGTVTAEVVDYCGNVSIEKRMHVIESTKKHQQTGNAEIKTLTLPGRTVQGVEYYNQDVRIQLSLEDQWSGIGNWDYSVKSQIQESENYKALAGTEFDKNPVQTIHHTMKKTVVLDAEANNENEVLVELHGTDNAGHELLAKKIYHIDVTKPMITVEYDKNEPFNGKYYKETRTAVVRIWERNFDPADVEFLIKSADGSYPKISQWSSYGTGDQTCHECSVTFDKDDEYSFSVKFTDMAGNTADYDRTDSFIIDRTAPEVTVVYDNQNACNGNYYNKGRTAKIEIRERNFDPDAVEFTFTVDGENVVSKTTGWIQTEAFCYQTQIACLTDGSYSFGISVKDPAMNESREYVTDKFIVDQTPPKLLIKGIENGSANRGEVKPQIFCQDVNYDKNTANIILSGTQQGKIEIQGKKQERIDGFTVCMEDFPYIREKDDLYTIQVTVWDLAGNRSTEEICFSVNRFGSVYTFDEATEALAGKNGTYYIREGQEIVITETNVDTLTFKEIVKNLNGKLETLKEGTDFKVVLVGTEETWKQYTYTIYAHNFAEEGNYILNIYSEDRAKNASDNHTKGKEIRFAVDRTPPTVVITGIETDGQYRTDRQNFLVDVQDQGVIKEVSVMIDDVEQIYDMEEIMEADGTLYFEVPAAAHEQKIRVTALDLAENQTIKEIEHVQVHGNVLVLWYLDRKLFYGAIVIGIVLLMSAGWYWNRKRVNRCDT